MGTGVRIYIRCSWKLAGDFWRWERKEKTDKLADKQHNKNIKQETHKKNLFLFFGEVGVKDIMLRIFVIGVMYFWARTKYSH